MFFVNPHGNAAVEFMMEAPNSEECKKWGVWEPVIHKNRSDTQRGAAVELVDAKERGPHVETPPLLLE
jgi:hypothetical protein